MDPYVLLNVKKGCTVDELKTNFKKISKRVHPDKGGDEHLFKLLIDAFRQILTEIKSRDTDKPHSELKAGYQRANGASASSSENTNTSTGNIPTFFQSTNPKEVMKKFNEFFEKNKLDNPEDVGYGEQMVSSSKTRDDISVSQLYKGPYNHDRFNSTFEQRVVAPKEHRLAVYEEPSSAFTISALATSDLSGQRPANFSGGGEKGRLQYEDYMQAHTTSRLVDTSSVSQRPSYRSIEEIKSARSKIPVFTEEEQSAYLLQVERQKRVSEDEMRAVRERDALLERHHMMVSRMLTAKR